MGTCTEGSNYAPLYLNEMHASPYISIGGQGGEANTDCGRSGFMGLIVPRVCRLKALLDRSRPPNHESLIHEVERPD